MIIHLIITRRRTDLGRKNKCWYGCRKHKPVIAQVMTHESNEKRIIDTHGG